MFIIGPDVYFLADLQTIPKEILCGRKNSTKRFIGLESFEKDSNQFTKCFKFGSCWVWLRRDTMRRVGSMQK
jgi:hypothetical protein